MPKHVSGLFHYPELVVPEPEQAHAFEILSRAASQTIVVDESLIDGGNGISLRNLLALGQIIVEYRLGDKITVLDSTSQTLMVCPLKSGPP